jgi:cell division protein FtsL
MHDADNKENTIHSLVAILTGLLPVLLLIIIIIIIIQFFIIYVQSQQPQGQLQTQHSVDKSNYFTDKHNIQSKTNER